MAKVGIMIEGQEGLNWDRWRRICHDTDTLGFDSLRRSESNPSVSVSWQMRRHRSQLRPSCPSIMIPTFAISLNYGNRSVEGVCELVEGKEVQDPFHRDACPPRQPHSHRHVGELGRGVRVRVEREVAAALEGKSRHLGG